MLHFGMLYLSPIIIHIIAVMILAGVIGGLLLLALVAVMGIWLVRDRKQTAKNSADRERNESFDHPDEYAKGKQSYGAT